LDAFRRSVPNLAVSTDIIVGFPGETETDFQATHDYLARARYDSAFLFKYSPRSGTKSYEWGDTLPEEEKLRRLQAVIHLQEKISLEKSQAWVGKTVEVLAEGPSKKSSNGSHTWFGKSPQFKTVVFKPKGEIKPGDKIPVSISSVTSHTFFGSGIKNEKNSR
jgi:tRNA-2-methylthio-N6-dimethylallyladenosine synthase